MPMTKQWAEAVVKALRADPAFTDVCDANNEGNEAPTDDAVALLQWLRQDEPEKAEEGGDNAQEYADFLVEEWLVASWTAKRSL